LFSVRPATTNPRYFDITNHNAHFIRVTDTEVDTVPLSKLLPSNDIVLISFCENWCKPSYSEINMLYKDGIIDFLKSKNVRLIILARKYPFLLVNQLDSTASDNIERDFEIYYYRDDLAASFPNLWIVAANHRLIYHSEGLQHDYLNIKDALNQYLSTRCPKCKGTGRVKANPHGDPDESVGICPWCGGKAH